MFSKWSEHRRQIEGKEQKRTKIYFAELCEELTEANDYLTGACENDSVVLYFKMKEGGGNGYFLQ